MYLNVNISSRSRPTKKIGLLSEQEHMCLRRRIERMARPFTKVLCGLPPCAVWRYPDSLSPEPLCFSVFYFLSVPVLTCARQFFSVEARLDPAPFDSPAWHSNIGYEGCFVPARNHRLNSDGVSSRPKSAVDWTWPCHRAHPELVI